MCSRPPRSRPLNAPRNPGGGTPLGDPANFGQCSRGVTHRTLYITDDAITSTCIGEEQGEEDTGTAGGTIGDAGDIKMSRWSDYMYSSFPYDHPENFYEFPRVSKDTWKSYGHFVKSLIVNEPHVKPLTDWWVNANRALEQQKVYESVRARTGGRDFAYPFLNYYGPMYTSWQQGGRGMYQEIAGAISYPHPLSRWC